MANANNGLPNGLISYGPNENCTLTGPDACPVSTGVYEYRPSIAANAVLLALFGLAMIIHIALGIKWRTWVFTSCIVWGCIAEIIGYGGRIILWQNPFSFTGFLMQISKWNHSLFLPTPAITKVQTKAEGLIQLSLHNPWPRLLHRSYLPNSLQNVRPLTPPLHPP